MNIGIVGSRSFTDYKKLSSWVDIICESISSSVTIVSGGARGADTLAEIYANDHNYELIVYKPDWTEGKQAGYTRNIKIVQKSDMIIAFWDKESKGTKSTIDLAKIGNTPTFIIYI